MKGKREVTGKQVLKRWTSGFVTSVEQGSDGWLRLVSTNQRGTSSVRMSLDEDETAALLEFFKAPRVVKPDPKNSGGRDT